MSGLRFLCIALFGLAGLAAGLAAGYQEAGRAVAILLGSAAAVLALDVLRLRRTRQIHAGLMAQAAARIVVLGIVASMAGATAGFLMWFVHGPSLWGRRIQCLSNVKSLITAMEMYLEDSDNAFPPVGVWRPGVDEYLPHAAELACPMADSPRNSYAYNAALSSAMHDSLAAPAFTVVIFESDRGWNAAGGPELLADAPRHLGGDNVGFADGHAAWLSRVRVSPDDPRKGYRKDYNYAEWLVWGPSARKPR